MWLAKIITYVHMYGVVHVYVCMRSCLYNYALYVLLNALTCVVCIMVQITHKLNDPCVSHACDVHKTHMHFCNARVLSCLFGC